jgi:hypothetical protein
MKKSSILLGLILTVILSFTLASCAGDLGGGLRTDTATGIQSKEVAEQNVDTVAGDASNTQNIQEVTSLKHWVEEVPRSDEQGAVSVVIMPLNLNNAWETIDFQVNMNTHSVDLSMDLTVLTTLTTDTGYSVQATLWDAPAGGHHVSGRLSFPATVEDNPILDGVERITLTVEDVDAPERVFVWER